MKLLEDLKKLVHITVVSNMNQEKRRNWRSWKSNISYYELRNFVGIEETHGQCLSIWYTNRDRTSRQYLRTYNGRSRSVVNLCRDRFLHSRSCGKCVHFRVINHLRVNMLVRAEYTQSRPLRCPFYLRISGNRI